MVTWPWTKNEKLKKMWQNAINHKQQFPRWQFFLLVTQYITGFNQINMVARHQAQLVPTGMSNHLCVDKQIQPSQPFWIGSMSASKLQYTGSTTWCTNFIFLHLIVKAAVRLSAKETEISSIPQVHVVWKDFLSVQYPKRTCLSSTTYDFIIQSKWWDHQHH